MGVEPIASVNSLPVHKHEDDGEPYLFAPFDGRRLTHQFFRFPAKFHAPVVNQLLADYTNPGACVFDPFCGSGTLLVEASILGRDSIGIDVDPLSVFISSVKTHALKRPALDRTCEQLLDALRKHRRSAAEYDFLMHHDLDEDVFREESQSVWIPSIPNRDHWFFRYVLIDLGQLLKSIDDLAVPNTHRNFLRLAFAATIRSASRADPVPVSGLEVTSVMLAKEKTGRRIDVFSLFERRLNRMISDMETYAEARVPGADCRVYQANAARIPKSIARSVDAVVTSPPYNAAVDYYRRHKLEMFWLGFTSSQAERLALLQKYIGRPKVPQRHEYVRSKEAGPAAIAELERQMRQTSPERADAFRHYAVGMSHTYACLAPRMKPGSFMIVVVGHSTWNGTEIHTSSLMEALSDPWFRLSETHWFPAKNRHMSYGRHNSANIDREYVLIFKRTRRRKA